MPFIQMTLYYTNKSNAIRIMYTYCINDTFIFIIDIIIAIFPLKVLVKQIKDSESSTAMFTPSL